MAKFLIIDDDPEVSRIIASVLEDEGYDAFFVHNLESANQILSSTEISTIFLDLWFGNDENAGFKILKQIKKSYPNIPIVMISGHGSVDNAVSAIKKGAYDFIEKPFTIDKLLLVSKRALELFNLKKKDSQYPSECDVYLLGNSKSITLSRNLTKKVSTSLCRVFIVADSGLGDDSIAKIIHNNSPVSDKKFIRLDCLLQNETEISKILFGNQSNIGGALNDNEIGTILIQNIFSLSKNLQSKLQQKLSQEHNIPRIISSSTQFDYQKAQYKKNFKYELLLRLSVAKIDIPPISSRREDIKVIVDFFLKNSFDIFGIKEKSISQNALKYIEINDWKGNIRQIKNIIEFALISAGENETILPEHLPEEIIHPQNRTDINLNDLITIPIKDAKNLFEKHYMSFQINRFGGQITKISKFVGMDRSALHRKLKSLGISLTHKEK